MYPVLHSAAHFEREYTDSSEAMADTFAQTEWPSSPVVPEHIKALLVLFFEVGDSASADSSRRLGEEVFTIDGQIVVNKKVISGAEGASWYSTFAVMLRIRWLTSVIVGCRDFKLKPWHIIRPALAQAYC